MQNYTEASKVYNEALQIQPTFAEAYVSLAELALLQGKVCEIMCLCV